MGWNVKMISVTPFSNTLIYFTTELDISQIMKRFQLNVVAVVSVVDDQS
jgi:hypothetical protein